MKKYSLCLAFLCVLMCTASAVAGEKEDVEAAFSAWRTALASGNAENVVSLYAPDAILLATLSANPITSQAGRRDYFSKLAVKPKISASVQEEHLKLLDEDNAVISGLYTFSYEQDGHMIDIPARYSFVFEKQNNQWLIVDHHSSKIPEAH